MTANLMDEVGQEFGKHMEALAKNYGSAGHQVTIQK